MFSWNGFVPRAMARWEQPGASVAVVERGRSSYVRGFGERRFGSGQRVDGDTCFGIASCSKTFAGVSVALLVADGKLRFDDRVIDILPWFLLSDPAVTEQVTVRDLLCNRLGIISSERRHRQSARNRRDLIERLRSHPFRHPFRAQYGYCTDAFTVIGEILSVVAGDDWAEFARDRIWRPLGMHRTNADHGLAYGDANHADPHVRYDGGFVPVEWVYEDHLATPAGGVNSTASDLVRWLGFLLGDGPRGGDALLPERLMAELMERHTIESGEFAEHELARVVGFGEGAIEDGGYGLGFYRHRYRGYDVVYHPGAIDGFQSILGILPDLGLGASVCINASNPYFAKLIFQATLDERMGLDGERWVDRFHQARCEAWARQDDPVRWEASFENAGPLEWLPAGEYLDETGFGRATVRRDGHAMVLEVGALIFDLCADGDGAARARKRWPYPVPPQFTLFPHRAKDGELLGFRTDQGACFAFLGPADAEGRKNS